MLILQTLFFLLGFAFVACCLLFIASAWIVQFLCILWSPFAGLISALYARRNEGLSIWRHALLGALYSAMLLGAWAYMMERIQGGGFSYKEIKRAYIWLYSLWIGVIVANTVLIIVGLRVGNGLWIHVLPIALIIAVIGATTWIVSIRTLLRKDTTISSVDILPDRAYILPFVYASANVMLIPSVFGVGWLLSPIF